MVFILLLLTLVGAAHAQDALYLPAPDPAYQQVQHLGYVLAYSEDHEQAAWVAYELTRWEVAGTEERTDNFRRDMEIRTGTATKADYRGSGYHRGHLVPAADMKWSPAVMSESFYFSNMSPQAAGFNLGVWKRLENWVRKQATREGAVYVVTGPVLSIELLGAIGINRVTVPAAYYKVIVDHRETEPRGIGFILANEGSKEPLEAFAVTIDSVEALTGLDFFPVLVDSVEEAMEGSLRLEEWGF